MKKIWIFILGVITGVALLFIVSLFISKTSSSNNGVTIFPEAGEILSENQFKVFQVLEDGAALATELSSVIYDSEFYSGINVLFISEGKHYYDDEIIRVPKGKCVRQIGVYKYPTKNGTEKTVPIVEISDK